MNFKNYKYLFWVIFFGFFSVAQNKEIYGKVIASDLSGFPGIMIFSDKQENISTTDLNGNFIIENAVNLKLLKFVFLGMQEEIVELNESCEFIQIVMLEEPLIDFVTLKKVNRIIQRGRNKNIPEYLNEAIEKKIFDADKMCNRQKIVR